MDGGDEGTGDGVIGTEGVDSGLVAAVVVVAVLVFATKPSGLSLSLSTGYRYRLYYETYAFLFSSVLFYYVVFLVVILVVVLLVLMMIRLDSITCCDVLCKIIRFEALNRQRERWIN
jgi:hypothetical protein